MSEPIFDVAVIGGGIAGCAAAIRLAQKNYRVVLCEAKSYPHHKVCGEFLSPECTELLDELCLTDAIQSVGPTSIHTAAIIAPDGTTWAAPLPGAAIGISRYALDELMAAQARNCGVDLRDCTTVNQVQGNLEQGFTLQTRGNGQQNTIHARTVIGAQGKRSTIDRSLDRPFLKKAQPFVGLKNHFRGSPLPGRIHLHVFPGGYCGMSEIENGLTNVCLLVQNDVFQREGSGSIPRFIEWMKGQNSALGVWFASAEPSNEDWISIAQVPFIDKDVVSNDILMVGDSAGLITPVAGDGMGMALHGSFMATKWLDSYLSGQVSANLLRQNYTAEWWAAFRVRLRLSRFLQTLMLRPRWLTSGLHVLNAIPALGHFLVTHTRESRVLQIEG